MKVEMHNGNVLVLPIRKEKSAGGVYLPENTKSTVSEGVVIEPSKMWLHHSGEWIASDLNYGDHVFYESEEPSRGLIYPKMFVDGKELIVIDEEHHVIGKEVREVTKQVE